MVNKFFTAYADADQSALDILKQRFADGENGSLRVRKEKADYCELRCSLGTAKEVRP